MDEDFDTIFEEEEFYIVEKLNLPKKELLAEFIQDDIFNEEEDLNFD